MEEGSKRHQSASIGWKVSLETQCRFQALILQLLQSLPCRISFKKEEIVNLYYGWSGIARVGCMIAEINDQTNSRPSDRLAEPIVRFHVIEFTNLNIQFSSFNFSVI